METKLESSIVFRIKQKRQDEFEVAYPSIYIVVQINIIYIIYTTTHIGSIRFTKGVVSLLEIYAFWRV